MKKIIRKILTITLCIIISIETIPVQIFALANIDISEDEQHEQEELYVCSNLTIVGEDETLRTENEKHFLVSDGSSLLVSYEEPVHYLNKEGNWKEINNRLTIDEDSHKYIAKQSEKTQATFYVELKNGEIVSTSAGDIELSMNLLTVEDVEKQLEEKRGVSKDGEETINSLRKYTAGKQYNFETRAEIGEKTPEETSSNGLNLKNLVPKNLTSYVTYHNVYKGVDFKYTLHGYNLKEQIIIKEKNDICRFDFLLKGDNLSATITKDGSVLILNTKGEKVYVIPAPYMEDAKGTLSSDVKYFVFETENGIVLSIAADSNWINAEERKYPVIIDPTLYLEASNNVYSENASIYATYTLSKFPDQAIATWGMPQHIFMGYEPSSGHTRGYYHFHNLPSIPDGCEAIGAYLGMYLFSQAMDGYNGYYGYNQSNLALELKEVTTSPGNNNYYEWLHNMSWNNQPTTENNTIIDYTVVNNSSSGEYISFDITSLAKKWYTEGTSNRTVTIVPAEENDQTDLSYAYVRTLSYGDTYPPMLIIAYRNTAGIEDYYTYCTLDAGHAGTAYISDHTGQLKLKTNIATYYSEINPISVSLVYNSDFFIHQNTAAYFPQNPSMDFGSGWTADCVQKLSRVNIGDTDYLKYTDGDGTEHYFSKDNSLDPSNTYYYDEDGLGLKIKASGIGYEMSDERGTIYTFSYGQLRSITNSNGLRINFSYSNGQLLSVAQYNANAYGYSVCDFNYDGQRVVQIETADGNDITLSYTGDLLTGISKGNTQIARYEYTGHRLSKMIDQESGYSLSFTYDQCGRVNGYYESAQGEIGSIYSIRYPNESQTAYKYFGEDGTEGTSDDILTSYLFDYGGRTVNAYTEDANGNLLGASNAAYTGYGTVDRRNNRTLRTAAMGESGEELLENGDFALASGWVFGNGANIYSDNGHKANGCMRIEGKWNDGLRNAYQDVYVNAPGTDTYILSGFALGNSVPNTNRLEESEETDDFKQFGLRAVIYYTDGTTEAHYSAFCPDLRIWQFTSMAVIPKESQKSVSKIRVYIVYEKNTGTAFYDEISLIKETCQSMKYDSEGNLVSISTTGLKEDVYTYTGGNLIEAVTGGYGTYSYTYDDAHNLVSITDGNLTQNMTYSTKGNITNTILEGGNLRLESSASYTNNGNLIYSKTDANGGTVSYRYSPGVSTVLGLPTRIIDGRNNSIYFDYDTLGRMTEVTAGNSASVGYTYITGNLSDITRTSGENIQNYLFGYDGYGNVTELSIGNRLLSEYTYALRSGNVLSETLGNGYTTSYAYDNRDRVVSWTDTHGNSQNYTYDEKNRISSVSGNDGDNVIYTYDSLDRLKSLSLSRDGVNKLYFLKHYNNYGQTTSRSYNLDGILYTQDFIYDDDENSIPDGLLTSMNMGINETLDFSYDSIGRIVSANGKTERCYTYLPGINENTSLKVDSFSNTFEENSLYECSFTYDANENILSENLGSKTWIYEYDSLNQLTSASDGVHTYTFTYDSAGNILSMSDGNVIHSYSYDDEDWKDLLTSYDGHVISYDQNGNPLSYYNGKDYSFTWSLGNALTGIYSNFENVETEASYGYSLDKVRKEKIVTKNTYHIHEYTVSETVAPTCSEDGYTIEVCSCGDTRNTNIVQALGHSYLDETILPTCTESGYILHTCQRCSDSYVSDIVAATGHNYIETVYTPTCLEEGYTLHTCSECGDSYMSDELQALGHDYTISVVMPTDGEDGYTLYTCQRCGYSYQGEYVAQEHIFVDTVVAPTCIDQGYTLHTCVDCGYEYTSDFEDALGHDYVETVTPPTCVMAGSTNRTCQRCGISYVVDFIPATGHFWRFGYCVVCGASQSGDPIVPPPGGDEPMEGPSQEEGTNEVQEDYSIFSTSEEHFEELPNESDGTQIRSEGSVLESSITKIYGYIYAGGKLLQETVTIDGIEEVHTFFYDNNGEPYAIKIDNTIYYYILNLQGDVVDVIDTNGNIVASYVYGPYGDIISESGELAEKNPLRYRGYYYDVETGFYYVSSRYYDPEIGRWINADIPETLTADFENFAQYNLFAYCFNNPVNMSDETGTWPSWVKKVVAAVAVVAVVAAVATVTVATAGAGTAAAVIAVGAAKGAAIGMASGAAIGAATGAVSHRVSTGSWSGAGTAALNGMGDGALSGAVTGAITGAAGSAVKVSQAAKAWDSGTFKSGYQSMKYHYNKHVVSEGLTKGNNVLKYTQDAVRFANRNSSVLKYIYNYNYGNASWNLTYSTGQGGMFTSAGKILTFWYR